MLERERGGRGGGREGGREREREGEGGREGGRERVLIHTHVHLRILGLFNFNHIFLIDVTK